MDKTLFCVLCGAEQRVDGDPPTTCSACRHETRWGKLPPLPPGADPATRYHLEPLDRRLLHAAGIAGDEPGDGDPIVEDGPVPVNPSSGESP